MYNRHPSNWATGYPFAAYGPVSCPHLAKANAHFAEAMRLIRSLRGTIH